MSLMLTGTLSGIEMGLALAKVPFSKGGVTAALDYLIKPMIRMYNKHPDSVIPAKADNP